MAIDRVSRWEEGSAAPTTLAAIVAVQILVLGCLRFVLYPELVVYPYLTAAGFLPYREILDQHFPGLLFLPVNFYTLGVRDAWGFHLLLMAVAALQTVLTFMVARRLAGATVAVFAAAAYAVWQPFFEGNQLWLDTFLPLFTLPAFLLLLDSRWFLAGLLLGAGVVFKQTLVPLVAFAGLLALPRSGRWGWDGVVRFAAGALLPSGLMLLHLHAIGVLEDFWFWAVRFNLSAYAKRGTLLPRLGDCVRLVLPIAVMLASSVVCRARWQAGLVALWACFTVAGGLARFGLIHVQPAVPYFAILLAMLLIELWRRRASLALVALAVLSVVWLGEFYGRRADWFSDRSEEERVASLETLVREKTVPSDEVLLLGLPPQIHASTHTLPPGRVFVFQFPWFLDVAGDRMLAALRDHPPKLVLLDTESGIDGVLLRDYAPAMVDEVHARYELTARLGTVEVYEQRP